VLGGVQALEAPQQQRLRPGPAQPVEAATARLALERAERSLDPGAGLGQADEDGPVLVQRAREARIARAVDEPRRAVERADGLVEGVRVAQGERLADQRPALQVPVAQAPVEAECVVDQAERLLPLPGAPQVGRAQGGEERLLHQVPGALPAHRLGPLQGLGGAGESGADPPRIADQGPGLGLEVGEHGGPVAAGREVADDGEGELAELLTGARVVDAPAQAPREEVPGEGVGLEPRVAAHQGGPALGGLREDLGEQAPGARVLDLGAPPLRPRPCRRAPDDGLVAPQRRRGFRTGGGGAGHGTARAEEGPAEVTVAAGARGKVREERGEASVREGPGGESGQLGGAGMLTGHPGSLACGLRDRDAVAHRQGVRPGSRSKRSAGLRRARRR
jgi:hypothetical protein